MSATEPTPDREAVAAIIAVVRAGIIGTRTSIAFMDELLAGRHLSRRRLRESREAAGKYLAGLLAMLALFESATDTELVRQLSALTSTPEDVTRVE